MASETQGRSETRQLPGFGVSLPMPRHGVRLSEDWRGRSRERAPGATRTLAALIRAPASPALKEGDGLFITCFSWTYFLVAGDQWEFDPLAAFCGGSLVAEAIHWEEPWIPEVLEGASGSRMCGSHFQPKLGVLWFTQGISVAQHSTWSTLTAPENLV